MTANLYGRIGQSWGLPLPGVVMIEASKQMYGAIPAGARTRRARLLVPAGAG